MIPGPWNLGLGIDFKPALTFALIFGLSRVLNLVPDRRAALSLKRSDYSFNLPPERIAQAPTPGRDESRLMVLGRPGRSIQHSVFGRLPDWLPSGALLVVNDTRVVPARLFGQRSSGGRVEVFLLDPPSGGAPGDYELDCLARPGRRMLPGTVLRFGAELEGEVRAIGENGRRRIRFRFGRPVAETLETVGRMPLPPYIRRDPDGDGTRGLDRERYQTVYARQNGAVAAPTAGLHFTDGLLDRLRDRGVDIASLTLHVGYGTFAPVREENLEHHRMHAERVTIPGETADKVLRAKADGRPVVAVGTTVVRSLEHAARLDRGLGPYEGTTELFIVPGFEFRVVDHLITNFHLPGSTLLMLVSALAGREFVLQAYREAVAAGYRFFSYGDAMLIL